MGRALAQRLARPFIDLDDRTLALLAAPTVAEAWNRAGVAAFRAAESKALVAALAIDDQVIALGGGTPTAPGAAEAIRAAQSAGAAKVVYLRAQPATLRARLAASGAGPNRPSLTGGDPLAEIDAVFAQRDPLYRDLADVIVNEAASESAAADAVIAALKG